MEQRKEDGWMRWGEQSRAEKQERGAKRGRWGQMLVTGWRISVLEQTGNKAIRGRYYRDTLRRRGTLGWWVGF